ncbi:hypothetical protein SAMN05216243_1188 [Sediminibacillus albus]|uniref:Uncharacterized protein n=1 Tax=Sediminibacillus albus TaxID=407036 RepID=A0A1G8X6M8_9BACI|nr:hypothetical protein SAMN05216243_1188 [Sediminibacillus albus]
MLKVLGYFFSIAIVIYILFIMSATALDVNSEGAVFHILIFICLLLALISSLLIRIIELIKNS